MTKFPALVLGVAAVLSTAPMAMSHGDADGKSSKKGIYEGTISGVVSDSMCKFDHAGMMKSAHATDATTCTLKCIQKGAKFVMADKKTDTVYTFVNSKLAKPFAGKSVVVSGHIDPQTKVIHIHSIKPQ